MVLLWMHGQGSVTLAWQASPNGPRAAEALAAAVAQLRAEMITCCAWVP